MPTFAKNTKVKVNNSKAEIESTVKRFGGKNVIPAEWNGQAVVFFEFNDKRVRFSATLPTISVTSTGRKKRDQVKALEQDGKVIWRNLLVSIIGRMAEMECGTQFEVAFADKIVLPNGQTAGVIDILILRSGQTDLSFDTTLASRQSDRPGAGFPCTPASAGYIAAPRNVCLPVCI